MLPTFIQAQGFVVRHDELAIGAQARPLRHIRAMDSADRGGILKRGKPNCDQSAIPFAALSLIPSLTCLARLAKPILAL